MYFNIDNTITRFGSYLNKYRFTPISIICHNCFNSQLSAMSSTLKALVICGPSGSGKSTLLNRLINELFDCFKFSISRKFQITYILVIIPKLFKYIGIN